MDLHSWHPAAAFVAPQLPPQLSNGRLQADHSADELAP
jgi:hypothetical protein